MGNKVKIGEHSKVNVKWKVLPIDYSQEGEETIKLKFAKKYGISKDNVTVEPQFIIKNEEGEDIVATDGIIGNIQDPIYQQSLFKPYLEEREVKDYDYDKIIEIDNLINSKINYEVYDKHKRYTIKWMKWSNFMSYGPNNFIDFTKFHGLVLLTSEPANQGGKTTFCLDLFRFLLFGKVTSREDDWVLGRAFNDFIPEATEMSVEGCISIDGQDYVIKRTLTRPALNRRTEKSKVTQKIEYYRLVNDSYVELLDYENMTENEAEQTGRETNKTIKEAIGNERDFDLMICVDSDNLKGLISLKDTDRGRLISRWIGLLPLEEKEKIAKDVFNHQIVPSLLITKNNVEELSETVEELENTNKELTAEIEKTKKNKDASEKKMDKLQKERETLLESKQKIDDNLMKVDVITLNTKISQVVEKGKIARAKKADSEKELKEFGDVDYDENEYQKLLSDDKENAINLTKATNEYNTLKSDIEALKKGEYCPTCGAKLKDVDNTEAIAKKQARMDEVVKLGKEYREKSKDFEKKRAEIEKKRADYSKKSKIELLIVTYDAEISKLLNEHREATQLLKDIQANKAAIEQNNKIDTLLNVNTENINVEKRIISEDERVINSNTANIETNKKNIKTLSDKIKIIQKEEVLVRNWKIYLDIIGKNGISKLVLRKVLPLINGELKRILNGVCDFDVEVRIDNDNSVAFYKIHDGVSAKLGSGSGLEQTIASLALRSVLSKISTFSKPSFVVFDEILGGVADENYDKAKLLYDKIVTDYQFILQITHLKAIADWHTDTITVIKSDNVSKIK